METGDIKLADLEASQTLKRSRQILADRIDVAFDESLTGKWETRVTIKLASGESFVRQRKQAAWQDERPMSRAEILEKFADAARVASEHVPQQVSETISRELVGLLNRNNVAQLVAAISGRGKSGPVE